MIHRPTEIPPPDSWILTLPSKTALRGTLSVPDSSGVRSSALMTLTETKLLLAHDRALRADIERGKDVSLQGYRSHDAIYLSNKQGQPVLLALSPGVQTAHRAAIRRKLRKAARQRDPDAQIPQLFESRGRLGVRIRKLLYIVIWEDDP